MSVTLDRIEGSGGKLTGEGWELTRTATVTGLSGDPYDMVIDAAGASGMPDIGDGHPSRPECILRDISLSSVSANAVELQLVYRDSDTSVSTIEVGSGLTQVETNKDHSGALITLEYEYPADYIPDPTKAGETIEQGGLVSKMSPETSIVYTRSETASPGSNSRNYTGKVNTGGWSGDPGAAARTWLCTGITGRSQDYGTTWEVTYTFQYRSDTWDETALFINPDDGKPPQDVVSGVGEKVIQVYTAIDFNGLGL